MRPVRVPAPHRKSIRRIALFNDAEFKALEEAVSGEGQSIARERLNTTVAEALSCDRDDASVLIDALLGAHSVHQRGEDSAEAVAAAIAKDPALELAEPEKSIVVARLTRLLDQEQLVALSRAVQLLREDEQAFCVARTLSDLRPVFRPGSTPPEAIGVVIRHTLQLRYHTDGPKTDAYFLTVDKSSLLRLRATVDRALAKDQALRQMAESSGLRIIDVEESH